MAKPSIYLAGPIAGCNPDQLHAWRDSLKAGFADEFHFIDPANDLVSPERSDFEVAQADAEAIKASDAILANMWRESIGTAIGVMHAHSVGKIVVVCDPNLIRSRTLGFYADAVERSLPAALASIRMFLRAQNLVLAVQKSNGEEENFDRRKLLISVRNACIGAKQSDVVPARAIVAKTLGILLDDHYDERIITTTEIKDAVWQAVADLAADPLHQADYDAIRQSWERYAAGKGFRAKADPKGAANPIVHDHSLEVKVRTQGTHSMIWGTKIGADALRIFDEITKVEGITEIVFGPFRNTGSPPRKPHVRLQASRTPHIIEGKCYDHGKKGTLQTFQVRVADAHQRDKILAVLRTHLQGKGHIRPIELNED